MGAFEHEFGGDGAAALFEDVAGDAGGEDVVRGERVGGGGAGPGGTSARLQHVGGRLAGAGADDVRDGVQPLAVPSEQARHDVEALQGGDFAVEKGGHGAEGDGVFAGRGADVGGQAVLVAGVQAAQADAQQGAHEVGAGDIEVGEVGAVGFVAVVVAVVGGVVGCGDEGCEEVAWGDGRRGLQVDLVEEAAEDAEVPAAGQVFEVDEAEGEGEEEKEAGSGGRGGSGAEEGMEGGAKTGGTGAGGEENDSGDKESGPPREAIEDRHVVVVVVAVVVEPLRRGDVWRRFPRGNVSRQRAEVRSVVRSPRIDHPNANPKLPPRGTPNDEENPPSSVNKATHSRCRCRRRRRLDSSAFIAVQLPTLTGFAEDAMIEIDAFQPLTNAIMCMCSTTKRQTVFCFPSTGPYKLCFFSLNWSAQTVLFSLNRSVQTVLFPSTGSSKLCCFPQLVRPNYVVFPQLDAFQPLSKATMCSLTKHQPVLFSLN